MTSPTWRWSGNRLLTMPVRTSSLRSLGAFLNVFAIESFMDELAECAGADPVAFRLAHLTDPRAVRVIEEVGGVLPLGGGPALSRRAPATGSVRQVQGPRRVLAPRLAEVEAEDDVHVRRLWLAVDVGTVINPDGVVNQVEGGAVQSTSWAIRERVTFDRAKITSLSWDNLPGAAVHRGARRGGADRRPRPGSRRTGAGEVAQGPVAAAIGNALAQAVGVRVRDLPLTREQVIRAIEGELTAAPLGHRGSLPRASRARGRRDGVAGAARPSGVPGGRSPGQQGTSAGRTGR